VNEEGGGGEDELRVRVGALKKSPPALQGWLGRWAARRWWQFKGGGGQPVGKVGG